jgi:hypothetical protein
MDVQHKLGQPLDENVCHDKEDNCGNENMDVATSISADRRHCLRQAFQRHRSLPQSSSASRFTARHIRIRHREPVAGMASAGHAAKVGMNTCGAGGLYPSEACGLIVL